MAKRRSVEQLRNQLDQLDDAKRREQVRITEELLVTAKASGNRQLEAMAARSLAAALEAMGQPVPPVVRRSAASAARLERWSGPV